MLTPFGKTSRKMRIDLGITLKDLAERTNVTSSYLSAIETGKRPLTKDILNKIINILASNAEEKALLTVAAEESAATVSIDITGKNGERKDVALAFARRFESLSDEDLKMVREILQKNHKTEE